MDVGRSAAVPDEVVNEEHLVEPVAREADVPAETEEIGYLHAKLLQFLGDPEIQQLVMCHWPVLWTDDQPQLDTWLSSVYAFSLGAALFTTVLAMAPEVQGDDLHLDLDRQTHHTAI